MSRLPSRTIREQWALLKRRHVLATWAPSFSLRHDMTSAWAPSDTLKIVERCIRAKQDLEVGDVQALEVSLAPRVRQREGKRFGPRYLSSSSSTTASWRRTTRSILSSLGCRRPLDCLASSNHPGSPLRSPRRGPRRGPRPYRRRR